MVFMNNELDLALETIAKMHKEIESLQEGYRIANKRYMDDLDLIREHALHAEQAAERADERVKEAAIMAADAADLAARTVAMAANCAKEQADAMGFALLEEVKLIPDFLEVVKAHIAEAAKNALEAQIDVAREIKLVADMAAKVIADRAVKAAEDAAETEAAMIMESQNTKPI